MTDRGTCWSITINNPSEKEMKCPQMSGWKLTGQLEEGKEGTQHYQGMLSTPQIRFSAVKKQFPRAHIELARNKTALETYVHKDDTRVGLVQDSASNIPTLFDYQHTIASRFNMVEFMEQSEENKKAPSDYVLDYVDSLVAEDIVNGVCGVEYIAINPMWRSAWKKFWRPMIIREAKMSADKKTDTDIKEDITVDGITISEESIPCGEESV